MHPVLKIRKILKNKKNLISFYLKLNFLLHDSKEKYTMSKSVKGGGVVLVFQHPLI